MEKNKIMKIVKIIFIFKYRELVNLLVVLFYSLDLKTLMAQYPIRSGFKMGKHGLRNYAEVDFKPEDEKYEKTKNEGIFFEKYNTVAYPTMALPDLINGLKKTLSMKGDIIGFDINKAPITDIYSRSGYAIPNTSTKTTYFPLFHHQLII
ncbi:unnamed protein product [Cunninghamella echinulata]